MATAVPINVQPPHLGTVPTDYPELLATVGYDGGNSQEVVVTWNVASNSGFSTGLQAVTTARTYKSGETARGTLTTKLTSGTWYIRAKSTLNAVDSAWTSTNTFTIAHNPFTSQHSPTHGSKVPYGNGIKTFSWVFGDADPSDRQTAYQVRAYRAANDALIFDTGKVISTAQTRSQTIISTYQSDYIYWQVRVWDTYDTPSAWSGSIMFKLGLEPVVYVSTPSTTTVTVPNPKIGWTFTTGNLATATYLTVDADYATYTAIDSTEPTYTDLLQYTPNAAEQSAYRVVVREGNTILHDSGWVAGTASSYVLPSIIHLGPTYTVVVYVRDTSLFEGESDPKTIVAAWTPPTPASSVTVDPSGIDDFFVGGVQISWAADNYDPTFVEWRVYRRMEGQAAWEVVATSNLQSGRGEIVDYLFIPGMMYEYAVVQAATRYFGDVVESIFEINSIEAMSEKYWLISSDEPVLTMLLPNVTSDSYTEMYEMLETNVIGRGRRLEYGTRFGYQGTLTAQLRGMNGVSPTVERVALESIKYNRRAAYLRVPCGQLWRVALGDVQVERLAGVGMSEYVDVTIPYSEVV